MGDSLSPFILSWCTKLIHYFSFAASVKKMLSGSNDKEANEEMLSELTKQVRKTQC